MTILESGTPATELIWKTAELGQAELEALIFKNTVRLAFYFEGLIGHLREQTGASGVFRGSLVVELLGQIMVNYKSNGSPRCPSVMGGDRYLNIVPVDQTTNLLMDLGVGTSGVDGRKPRSDGSMGNDVLTGRESSTKDGRESDQPTLRLAVCSVNGGLEKQKRVRIVDIRCLSRKTTYEVLIINTIRDHPRDWKLSSLTPY